jgi:hypothetical protein
VVVRGAFSTKNPTIQGSFVVRSQAERLAYYERHRSTTRLEPPPRRAETVAVRSTEASLLFRESGGASSPVQVRGLVERTASGPPARNTLPGMRHPRYLPAIGATLLTASLLLSACGGQTPADDSIPTITTDGDEPLSWSEIALRLLGRESTVTVIVPDRKCWEGYVEGHDDWRLGACRSFRYSFIGAALGTVRIVKQSRGPWPLTVIVELNDHEAGRATTTEPNGSVEVPD